MNEHTHTPTVHPRALDFLEALHANPDTSQRVKAWCEWQAERLGAAYTGQPAPPGTSLSMVEHDRRLVLRLLREDVRDRTELPDDLRQWAADVWAEVWLASKTEQTAPRKLLSQVDPDPTPIPVRWTRRERLAEWLTRKAYALRLRRPRPAPVVQPRQP